MSKKSATISTSLSAESADCAQNDFDSVKNSLNDVLLMVESLKTKGSFEATIKSTIQVLIKHMQVLSTKQFLNNFLNNLNYYYIVQFN